MTIRRRCHRIKKGRLLVPPSSRGLTRCGRVTVLNFLLTVSLRRSGLDFWLTRVSFQIFRQTELTSIKKIMVMIPPLLSTRRRFTFRTSVRVRARLKNRVLLKLARSKLLNLPEVFKKRLIKISRVNINFQKNTGVTR